MEGGHFNGEVGGAEGDREETGDRDAGRYVRGGGLRLFSRVCEGPEEEGCSWPRSRLSGAREYEDF